MSTKDHQMPPKDHNMLLMTLSLGCFEGGFVGLLLERSVVLGVTSSPLEPSLNPSPECLQHLPNEGDMLPGHLLEVADGRRLASEAVVGVVVGHDGGGAELAQLILRALQLQLHGLQLLVLPAVHCGQMGSCIASLSSPAGATSSGKLPWMSVP